MANALTEWLNDEVIDELSGTEDTTLALRLALLHCIVLLEDKEEPGTRKFVGFLLTHFSPLAGAFHRHKHRYVRDLEVLRGKTEDGHLGLMLPLERIRRLIGR